MPRFVAAFFSALVLNTHAFPHIAPYLGWRSGPCRNSLSCQSPTPSSFSTRCIDVSVTPTLNLTIVEMTDPVGSAMDHSQDGWYVS